VAAFVLLAFLAAVSLALTIWQIAVAARFPLHRRSGEPEFGPAISILKPLKGCDAKTRECLRSWFTQNYTGDIELLFGVASEQDPVCEIVRDLMREHPACPAHLIVCDRTLGPNAKVSKLACLERLAIHDVVCVSDADVWVPPDFLANAIAPLGDAGVGLVNCFYRFATPANLAMRWEAFAVNADFWSQVLQSLSLRPMHFALGAAMLMPRARLLAIGGFEQLADHVADDYQLGNRIMRQGARVVVSPMVVECRTGPVRFGEVWTHQLRWARTIRVCQPWPFFCSVIGNGSLWPLLWAVARPGWPSFAGAGLCLAVRWAAGVYLEGKMTGKHHVFTGGLAVAKDLLQFAIWALAFASRKVSWRGVDYHVKPGGKLVRISDGTPAPASPV
jgi:ceramide glucosyltransferase